MFAPTLIIFPYHSSLMLLTKQRILLFFIDVSEHCVFALTLFLSSASLGRTIDATHAFEGITSLVESGILLPLSTDVH